VARWFRRWASENLRSYLRLVSSILGRELLGVETSVSTRLSPWHALPEIEDRANLTSPVPRLSGMFPSAWRHIL
jgi:hypothetical protein